MTKAVLAWSVSLILVLFIHWTFFPRLLPGRDRRFCVRVAWYGGSLPGWVVDYSFNYGWTYRHLTRVWMYGNHDRDYPVVDGDFSKQVDLAKRLTPEAFYAWERGADSIYQRYKTQHDTTFTICPTCP